MAFLHGIKVPHRKHTADMQAVRMPAPQTVTIPTQMHIGKPAKPIVKAGDQVFVGTLIAEADGYVSAPVHSSVSGVVKKIDQVLLANGSTCPAIVIESDGEMKADEAVVPPVITSKEDFVNAVKASGIVGLGGAGFPTSVKVNAREGAIDELIINGAECEPYITSDNRTMIDRREDMALAIAYLQKYLQIQKIIIGIEKNKPEAIKSMQVLTTENPAVTVKPLPSVYPQGGEKVMIYHTTGKVVPVGKLPLDVGCLVLNCTTTADIGKFIRTGMPLVEKCVTVDGSAVQNPMNVIAPIGASLASVFEFTGGFKSQPGKVIYGGPMMGIAVPNLDLPLLKNNNAVLAFNKKDAVQKKPRACINCSNCVNVCPFGVNPPAIAKALAKHDVDTMVKVGADACMECGCCAFVCPANRPIIQNHRLAKAEIRQARAKKETKEDAKS